MTNDLDAKVYRFTFFLSSGSVKEFARETACGHTKAEAEEKVRANNYTHDIEIISCRELE